MAWTHLCVRIASFSQCSTKILRRGVPAPTSPALEHGHPSTTLGKTSRNSRGEQSILGSTGKMANPKRQTPKQVPGGKAHCASQDTSKDTGVSAWSFPLSSCPLQSVRFGKGQRWPLHFHALAAFAALFSSVPSGWLCRASSHHGPGLGRGDVGHACVLGQSPLPDPKETRENVKSCSVSYSASLSSSIQNKHQACSNSISDTETWR